MCVLSTIQPGALFLPEKLIYLSEISTVQVLFEKRRVPASPSQFSAWKLENSCNPLSFKGSRIGGRFKRHGALNYSGAINASIGPFESRSDFPETRPTFSLPSAFHEDSISSLPTYVIKLRKNNHSFLLLNSFLLLSALQSLYNLQKI